MKLIEDDFYYENTENCDINRKMAKNVSIIIVLFAILFSSCTSYKDLIYMKDIASQSNDTTFLRERVFYQVQRGDILYIRIVTNDDEIDQLFNIGGSVGGNQGMFGQNGMMGGGMLYFQGYSVNDSGFIDLPIVHKIMVLGKTVDEIKEAIESKLLEHFEDFLVIVKLDKFKITFVGEVNNPQVLELQQNKLNVIEALGKVGGISYTGNHKDLLVIRPLDNGSRVFRLDMTDKSIIESSNFELLPNDIVYVAPRKSAWFRRETSENLTFWLSALSTSISTVLLVIALL